MSMAEEFRVIRVIGCRQGKQGNCPHTRMYNSNENEPTLGCVYKYGSLPEAGFPEWCPLSLETVTAKKGE